MSLYPHQLEALKELDKHEGYALFFEMGTGKTRTIIKDMERRFADGRNRRALVIAPLSVVHSWVDEITRFSHLSAVAIRGTPRQRRQAMASDAQVKIINYDLLAKEYDELYAMQADYLVADESQRLISPSAKWTRAALKLSRYAKTKRVLSGTPIRNWPIDLYNQMKFIDPDILPWRSHFAFRKQFAIEVNRGGFMQIVGVRNEHEIHRRCAPYVRYVTFDEVVKDMPSWVEEVRTVPLNAEQKRVYQELRKDLLARVNGELVPAQNAAVLALRLSQVAGGTLLDSSGTAHILGTHKLKELKSLLEDNPNKQCVVWCKFTAEIRWLSEELDAPCIFGETPAVERERILKHFEAGEVPVLIAQVQALSEGVNELRHADYEVRWSYDWSYSTFVQSRARIRRIGRSVDKPCVSVMLVAEGTTDMKVLEAVRRKESVAVNTLEQIKELIE